MISTARDAPNNTHNDMQMDTTATRIDGTITVCRWRLPDQMQRVPTERRTPLGGRQGRELVGGI